MDVEDKFFEWLKLISALLNWPLIFNTASKPGHYWANLSYAFLGVEAPFQTELQISIALLIPTLGLMSRIISKYFHVTEFFWRLLPPLVAHLRRHLVLLCGDAADNRNTVTLCLKALCCLPASCLKGAKARRIHLEIRLTCFLLSLRFFWNCWEETRVLFNWTH